MSANALYYTVVVDGKQRVGLASIYRTLGLLVQLGLLNTIDFGDRVLRYERTSADGSHHHHMVCDVCGRTEVFTDPALESQITRIAESASYVVAGHDLVLRGTCPQCNGRNASAA